MNYTE